MPELAGCELQQAALDSNSIATGIDLWSYDDRKLLLIVVFDFFVMILCRVEDGAPWPRQLLHQTAHVLSEDPKMRPDPL